MGICGNFLQYFAMDAGGASTRVLNRSFPMGGGTVRVYYTFVVS